MITTAGPLGMRSTRLRVPLDSHIALLVGGRQIGVGAVVARAARDHAQAQRLLEHRHVEALDRGDALDVGVDQVGQPPEVTARPGGAERGPGGERVDGRADRELGDLGAAARDLGEQRPVERRVILERLGARDAPAADEVVDRDVGPATARAGARAAPPSAGRPQVALVSTGRRPSTRT